MQDLIKYFTRKYDINEQQILWVISYLKNFGYLKEEFNEQDLHTATLLFQQIFNIETDGEIGPQTFRTTLWPRCGHKDIEELNEVEYIRRWNTKDIKVAIIKTPSSLSKEDFLTAINESFNDISAICGLNFRITQPQEANILVSIGRGNRDNFDGPSNTLAWCELPGDDYSGRPLNLRFDDDESFIYKSGRGILVKNVFSHELLHGLGLTHSNVRTALMAPSYNPLVDKPQQNDDISRLVIRYGEPSQPPPPPPSNEYVIRFRGDISVDGYRLIKK